jgi:hypothetical protein
MLFFATLIASTATAFAQDPAGGWMAYAVGTIPADATRITRLDMTWTVGAEPKRSRAFFSPWFGMDPADNLNLIQPVNPWSGSAWSMYTEYYQWKPTHNSNSKQYPVQAGQTLSGSMVYDAATDSYTLSQTIVETGVTSSQVVACQDGKKYTIPYVVYEKTFPCADYPPDEIVTFRDVYVECDGADCTSAVQWRADVEDDNCAMEAHISQNSTNTEISITWDTSLSSKYDGRSYDELVELNNKRGFKIQAPAAVVESGSGSCSCQQYGGGTCSGFCNGNTCPCMNCQIMTQTC